MTVSRVTRYLLLAPVVLPFIVSDMAFAQQRQELDPNVTVQNRPRPEYDPIGARVGAFRILPELAITGAYSDNVGFDDKGAEQSDYIAIFRPSVQLRSDWSRHALGIELGSEVALHAKEGDEDYQDFFANGDGVLEISRQTNLKGNVGAARGSENQAEGDNNEIEDFTAVDGGLALSHQLNRVVLTVSGDAQRVVFDDSDQDDENRNEYNALLRTTYEMSPRLDLFVEGRYNILNYDENDQVTGDDQDSSGYEGRLGAGVDLTSVLFGEAFAGYRVQQFDEGGFDDETGFSFGVDLNWNVTQLTSIGVTGKRDFEASDQAGANSNFQTQVALSVAHELFRNVIIDGDAVYENDDFRGIDRQDDTYKLGAGATYWVNRNISVNAGYDYSNRNSNQAGEDFEANQISIGLTLRL